MLKAGDSVRVEGVGFGVIDHFSGTGEVQRVCVRMEHDGQLVAARPSRCFLQPARLTVSTAVTLLVPGQLAAGERVHDDEMGDGIVIRAFVDSGRCAVRYDSGPTMVVPLGLLSRIAPRVSGPKVVPADPLIRHAAMIASSESCVKYGGSSESARVIVALAEALRVEQRRAERARDALDALRAILTVGGTAV